MNKLSPDDRIELVDRAIHHLKLARDYLKTAGAPQTLGRVRRALTSAGGAKRHAEGRRFEPYGQGRNRSG